MNAKQRRKAERQGVLIEIGSKKHTADFLWIRKGGLYHFCGYTFRPKVIIHKRSRFYPEWGWSTRDEEIQCNGYEIVTDMSRRSEEKRMIDFLSKDSILMELEEEFLELWGMVEYLEMESKTS